ncbi:sucrose-6-phosphate hydrolase [Coriobacterium glomerans PW2]|uniref:Sucrose-6-phosphate hydrolase n=1 Tax=Coriobacterium glomerans (strain ATCC 49209 / DSM 20642 / JCM 10262 / PW2) TaxID=700015 RepID=F2NBG6_CORGP|nr:glycoside hydrolase family 32 protein [Coriobacterium glomerans]AEB06702.1 sucrose-6-phosphate hydrolase [Coriobacterium glomerans PW2]
MQIIDESRSIAVTNERFRPRFHIATPGGWLNDPNGLCFFKGFYHVFYQFHPYSAEWGPMHWGHVRSRDLIHWEQLPAALVPGDPEDEGGCFSGSAIVRDGRLYVIYTGQHYYGDGDPEHFWENQNIAWSDDGVNFTKFEGNPVICAPEDNSQHFRDPKVWQLGDAYYAVIGSQDAADLRGRALMYRSDDLMRWESIGVISRAADAASEGAIWECPDLFRLNGRDVLVCSPQKMPAAHHRFLNVDQNAYFIGQLDYEAARLDRGELHELDSGHNFYAPQSFLAPDGRRIQFGWMSSFGAPMPEQSDGWAGMLTVPRELIIMDDDTLGAVPVRELAHLRKAEVINETMDVVGSVTLQVPDPQHLELDLDVSLDRSCDQISWVLECEGDALVSLTFSERTGELSVHQRGAASDRYAEIGSVEHLRLQIIVDTSSVEIFVNSGAATFTERYYADAAPSHQVRSTHPARISVSAHTLSA